MYVLMYVCYVCIPCMCPVLQKMVSVPLELELEKVGSYHVGVRSQT